MDSINEHLFINPGVNIGKNHKDIKTIVNLSKEEIKARWENQLGQSILSKWRANNFDRKMLNQLVGKYYDHTDIRGISLVDEKISDADLSDIDFYGSDLKNTKVINSNLSDSWLSESDIRGTRFEWCDMDRALIDNAEFDNRTTFVGVNLNTINFTLSWLLQNLAIGQRRIQHLKKKNPNFALFLKYTCDYGRSIYRWLLCVLTVLLFFGLAYWLIPETINKKGFVNSMYFSFITFTTLGYGDIVPISILGKILVIIEVFLGYVMGGLLVAILARKMIGD